MSYGVKLHVWGDYACFTRPEMKVERVSYDVITPSAARGIIEAVYWKPAIRWVVDRIHVLKPIQFVNIRKNEVSDKISARNAQTAKNTGDLSNLHMVVEDKRQQRAMMALRDVAYVIEAHFEMTNKAGSDGSGSDDNPAKHYDVFRRRAQKGQCFHRPALGVREFVADFNWVETVPPSDVKETRDLGWMLYDINFATQHEGGVGKGKSKKNEAINTPQFYRATMVDGVIDVAAARAEGFVK